MNSSTHDHRGKKGMKDGGAFGSIYGLAFIGAAVYYIQDSSTFWEGCSVSSRPWCGLPC